MLYGAYFGIAYIQGATKQSIYRQTPQFVSCWDCEFYELASETERHLIIAVVHWRAGVHADVKGFVDAHQEGDGVRDR
jgi:hypothetical protein